MTPEKMEPPGFETAPLPVLAPDGRYYPVLLRSVLLRSCLATILFCSGADEYLVLTLQSLVSRNAIA
jgi:hypothetical protein